MKSGHNITQNHSIVNVTADTSDALLCARTLAPPVCTAAGSPTANSGRGLINASRSIRGRWCSMAVLIAFAAALFVCGTASAADIYVGTGETHTTIQSAVTAATAGDTIIVRDGIYNENVDVGKQLTIRSENGSASCIVTAALTSDHVFEVTTDYVNISGFNVAGATDSSKAGFYLSARGYVSNESRTLYM